MEIFERPLSIYFVLPRDLVIGLHRTRNRICLGEIHLAVSRSRQLWPGQTAGEGESKHKGQGVHSGL